MAKFVYIPKGTPSVKGTTKYQPLKRWRRAVYILSAIIVLETSLLGLLLYYLNHA